MLADFSQTEYEYLLDKEKRKIDEELLLLSLLIATIITSDDFKNMFTLK